jgi:hypothetical protein
VGVINKYSSVGGNWVANGSFTNSTGVDGLFATTNGDGGVNLFYTTGGGGTPKNSIVRVTDAAGWNQNIRIVSSNVLYTATGSATLKGLTFVPQQATNAAQLLPPPILTAQSGATVTNTFTIANSPADAAWHGAITNITVNGSTLPPAAYNIAPSNQIVFDTAGSVLLQEPGAKTITVAATGYSTASVVQTLVEITPSLVDSVSLNGTNLSFTLTSQPNLTITVLSTTNVALPISQWRTLGNATEGPTGHYEFTDPSPATNAAVFYTVIQP